MSEQDDSSAAASLTEPEIDALVGQYQREMARYEKAAQFVADRLHREIRAATLKHLITFRAKHPDDLRGKLRKKAADARYSYERLRTAMDTIVTDLAGCRVLVYDPADEARVAEIARRALALRVELRGYFEHHSKPSGYRATHLLVGVPEGPETFSFQNAVCEVQVSTLAAHMFSELEHDVTYKDHGVPSVADEREAIDNLHKLSVLLDRAAGAALRLRAHNVASTTRTIANADELRYVLEQRAGRTLRGDFVRLFRLLASLFEPIAPRVLGDVPDQLRAGAERAEQLALGTDDDVVAFALGMMRDYMGDFVAQASGWRGPEGALKTAILRAGRVEVDHG